MKHILLAVDVQQGFVVPGANDGALANIDRLVEAEIFDTVIATAYHNYEGSPIIRFMGWDSLFDPEEIALTGAVAKKHDHLLQKTTYSACNGELLDLLRRENGGELPGHVFLVGMDTECCVLATATDLFEAGVRPIVLTLYCGASGGEGQHLAGVRSMASLIGTNDMYHREVTCRADLDAIVARAQSRDYKYKPTDAQKEQTLVDLLTEKGLHIAFAESCTAGKAAARLVNVANASRVLDASFVTYANEAKVRFLGVDPRTIADHGVVSEEVALQMARGAAKAAGADVGVGISGIAGPGGGTDRKPVGMVCFGLSLPGRELAFTRQFGPMGRSAVREASVEVVFDTLIELLKR